MYASTLHRSFYLSTTHLDYTRAHTAGPVLVKQKGGTHAHTNSSGADKGKVATTVETPINGVAGDVSTHTSLTKWSSNSRSTNHSNAKGNMTTASVGDDKRTPPNSARSFSGYLGASTTKQDKNLGYTDDSDDDEMDDYGPRSLFLFTLDNPLRIICTSHLSSIDFLLLSS